MGRDTKAAEQVVTDGAALMQADAKRYIQILEMVEAGKRVTLFARDGWLCVDVQPNGDHAQ